MYASVRYCKATCHHRDPGTLVLTTDQIQKPIRIWTKPEKNTGSVVRKETHCAAGKGARSKKFLNETI